MIEVLVGLAITAIVAAAFASLLETQFRETKAVGEKLATMDLEKLLIASLADGKVCSYALNNPAPMVFNSSTLPQKILLKNPTPQTAALYTSVNNGVPGPIAAQVGQTVSPLSSSLTVKSIELEIISGPAGGGSGTYLGRWIVSFENSVRALRPITVSTTLQVDASGGSANAKISSCQSSSSSATKISQQVFTNSGAYIPCPGLVYAQVELVGGGGGGGSGYSVFGGAGGGSGAYARAILKPEDIGNQQPVIVGAGGTGGVASGPGGNGGTTTFGSTANFGGLLSAGGGAGGPGGSAGVNCTGGAGGVVGTTPINGDGFGVPGAAGGGCIYYYYWGAGGSGARSYFGGGGSGGGASAVGLPGAMGGGGGGSGASLNLAGPQGGNGGAGMVIVTEYCQ